MISSFAIRKVSRRSECALSTGRGRTGQLLNLSGLGADCGITQPTAKSWLSVLEASYIVFRLPALHTNVRKRLVKAPKLYFHDTGLLCYLLGIRTPEQLETHPLRGAVFECWAVSEILKYHLHRGRRVRRAGAIPLARPGRRPTPGRRRPWRRRDANAERRRAAGLDRHHHTRMDGTAVTGATGPRRDRARGLPPTTTCARCPSASRPPRFPSSHLA